MKILSISNLYYPYAVGGAERIAQMIAEAMVARGHQVTVVTVGRENHKSERDLNGVRIRYIPIRNISHLILNRTAPAMRSVWHLIDSFNPAAGRDVGRIIHEERPDLVHTHNVAGFSCAVWSVVKRHQLPCVHTMHDYYLICSRSSLFCNGNNCERICYSCRILSTLRNRLITKIEGVVAVSKFVLELHERTIEGFRNIAIRRTIINGCSASTTAHQLGESAAEAVRIGFLGRLVERKGLSKLLEEFERLDSRSNVSFLIGGEGRADYVAKLHARYRDDDRIHFLGAVNSGHFLNRIDVLAVPSLWNDPCPLVVGEAISRGKPVLGARRGGIPELIREGVDGFLFEPTVRGDFGLALERAIECGLMTNQREWSTDHLTAEKMVNEYEDVYRSVME